eukprot:86396-Chlamydomonas_euryale.AAC.17
MDGGLPLASSAAGPGVAPLLVVIRVRSAADATVGSDGACASGDGMPEPWRAMGLSTDVRTGAGTATDRPTSAGVASPSSRTRISSRVMSDAMLDASAADSARSSIISAAIASAVSSSKSNANSIVLQLPSGSTNRSWNDSLPTSPSMRLHTTAKSRPSGTSGGADTGGRSWLSSCALAALTSPVGVGVGASGSSADIACDGAAAPGGVSGGGAASA